MREITEEEWFETYKPIKHRDGLDQGFNGTLIETYGRDLEWIKSTPDRYIWTWTDGGDYSVISNGVHYVNRMGYFICEVPYEIEDDIVIDIYEPHPCEENDEHLWIPSKGFSEQMCEWCGVDKGEWEEYSE
jgi:hypothetical protein